MVGRRSEGMAADAAAEGDSILAALDPASSAHSCSQGNSSRADMSQFPGPTLEGGGVR